MIKVHLLRRSSFPLHRHIALFAEKTYKNGINKHDQLATPASEEKEEEGVGSRSGGVIISVNGRQILQNSVAFQLFYTKEINYVRKSHK